MLGLIKKQTSIAEVTTNVIKKTRDELENQFREFNSHFEKIIRDTNAQQSFLSATVILMLRIVNYQHIQDALLNIVLDTQHGTINLLLLEPDQFTNQLTIIQKHVPTTVMIPGYGSAKDLQLLYKIIDIKTRVLDNMILFAISIPLITRESFQLFHVIPIPVQHGEQLLTLSPEAPYLAVNMDRNKYWYLTESAIHDCKKIKTDSMICFDDQQIYTPQSETSTCEMDLFTHHPNPHKNCVIKMIQNPHQLIWRKMKAQNNWITYARNKQAINVTCEKTIDTAYLQGTNIVQLEPTCQIKSSTTNKL